jgi:putative membrane protein
VIRLLVRLGLLLAANAVGLIVAAVVLDGMEVDLTSFVIAVAIFTAVAALLQPFLVSFFRDRNWLLVGGVTLLATLASLIITAIVSDGFSIDEVVDWPLAALIVWGSALVAGWVLPYLGLRKYLESRDDRR